MRLLKGYNWTGCGDEVRKCNIIARREAGVKDRLSFKRMKILALNNAKRKINTMLRSYQSEFNKLKEKEAEVGQQYAKAMVKLRKKRATLKAAKQKRENEETIRRLNL